MGKRQGRRFGSENAGQKPENERSGKKQRVEGNATKARSPLQEQGNAVSAAEPSRFYSPLGFMVCGITACLPSSPSRHLCSHHNSQLLGLGFSLP